MINKKIIILKVFIYEKPQASIQRVNTFGEKNIEKILNKLPKSDDDLTQFTFRVFCV